MKCCNKVIIILIATTASVELIRSNSISCRRITLLLLLSPLLYRPWVSDPQNHCCDGGTACSDGSVNVLNEEGCSPNCISEYYVVVQEPSVTLAKLAHIRKLTIKQINIFGVSKTGFFFSL